MTAGKQKPKEQTKQEENFFESVREACKKKSLATKKWLWMITVWKIFLLTFCFPFSFSCCCWRFLQKKEKFNYFKNVFEKQLKISWTRRSYCHPNAQITAITHHKHPSIYPSIHPFTHSFIHASTHTYIIAKNLSRFVSFFSFQSMNDIVFQNFRM